MDVSYLQKLAAYDSFSRSDLLSAIRDYGMNIGEATLKVMLDKLLKAGTIIRVGRNAYCISNDNIRSYSHMYGKLACDVAKVVSDNFPYTDFTVFELTQLNVFVNHQIGQNVIFISADSEAGDFIFDNLKNIYPGKVLLNPAIKMYQRYLVEDMIIIEKLISEAPLGTDEKWHTRLEKILVDIIADPLIRSSVGESEYANIYEEAFGRYAIDESCMFRYARRRSAETKIKNLIRDNTNIKLRRGR